MSEIIPVENALGFKFPKGIKRDKGCKRIPIVQEFNREIDRLTETYSSGSLYEMKRRADLDQRINALWREIGPRLWPDGDERFEWLSDARENTMYFRYQVNLYYSNPEHRNELFRNFKELICRKCAHKAARNAAESSKQAQARREAVVYSDAEAVNEMPGSCKEVQPSPCAASPIAIPNAQMRTPHQRTRSDQWSLASSPLTGVNNQLSEKLQIGSWQSDQSFELPRPTSSGSATKEAGKRRSMAEKEKHRKRGSVERVAFRAVPYRTKPTPGSSTVPGQALAFDDGRIATPAHPEGAGSSAQPFVIYDEGSNVTTAAQHASPVELSTEELHSRFRAYKEWNVARMSGFAQNAEKEAEQAQEEANQHLERVLVTRRRLGLKLNLDMDKGEEDIQQSVRRIRDSHASLARSQCMATAAQEEDACLQNIMGEQHR